MYLVASLCCLEGNDMKKSLHVQYRWIFLRIFSLWLVDSAGAVSDTEHLSLVPTLNFIAKLAPGGCLFIVRNCGFFFFIFLIFFFISSIFKCLSPCLCSVAAWEERTFRHAIYCCGWNEAYCSVMVIASCQHSVNVNWTSAYMHDIYMAVQIIPLD